MSRLRPSLLPFGILLLAACVVPAVRADVGPSIKVRWSGEWPAPARPGAETIGQFEILSGNAGVVENLRVEGEGWSVRATDAPSRLVMPPRSNRRFTFRAAPTNPQAPIVVSGTVNGMPFRKRFRLDEERLSKIGKPGPARLDGAGVMGTVPEGPGEAIQTVIRFRGRVVYTRSDNSVVGADNIHVRIMDDDPIFPFVSEQIGSVITDAAGNFDVTIDWDDTNDPGGPDAPDVYLLIESGNSVVQVRTDDTEEMYVWTTEAWTYWDFTGTELDFGDIIPLTDIPAVHLMTATVKANRHASGVGGMPAPHVKVNWPDSDDRSFYSNGFNEIHIGTTRSWNEGTAVHEYGHHLSASFSSLLPSNYENGFCDDPTPGHCVWCPENDVDAWQEGWANWFASRMLRVWEGAYGYEPLSIDDDRFLIENTQSCGQDMTDYPQSNVENYVAALLRDIEDGENEGLSGQEPSDPFDCSGDRLSLGDVPIFLNFRDADPTTVWEFIQSFRASNISHERDLWNTIENNAPSLNFPRPALGFWTQPPACQSGRAGETITLDAGANGGIVRYRWHRNGVALFNGSGVTGAFTGTLQLGPLTPALAGSYTCQAMDCDGVTSLFSSATELRVDPAAPPATPFLSWGVNGQGTVGDGTTSDTRPPSVHAGMTDVVAVEGGINVTIALRAGGEVLTWGTPQFGELGQGQWWTPNYTPTPILSGIAEIAAGKYHGLALERDGTLKVWGRNFYGQLFRGNRDDLHTPQPAINLGCVKDLAAGEAHSLALLGDGTIRSVGYNTYGCLGVGTTTLWELTPQVVPLTNVVQIQAAYFWSMALRADSTVWTWGINTSGQLGLGHFNTVTTPTQVPGLTGIKQIFAGESNGYALRSDGKLFAWGDGPGIGVGYTGGSSWVPLEVPLSNVSKVGGGWSWVMAIVDGNLWGWGLNAGGSPTIVGILNNTGPYVQPSPVPVTGLFNVAEIFGGWTTAHALGQPGVLDVTPPPAVDRPTVLALAARPNPARGSMSIHYDLPSAAPVRLRVYDAAGRFVRELMDEEREAGRYVTSWDGRSAAGARVSAGLYFLRLEAGDRRMSRTLIRIE